MKENKQEGLFEQMLKRSAPQLRSDRAGVVQTKVEKDYRRRLEDLLDNIDQYSIDLTTQLDLSSDSTTTIINPANIDSGALIDKRASLIQSRRNDFNKYFSLYYDYKFLFGTVASSLLDPNDILKKYKMGYNPLEINESITQPLNQE